MCFAYKKSDRIKEEHSVTIQPTNCYEYEKMNHATLSLSEKTSQEQLLETNLDNYKLEEKHDLLIDNLPITDIEQMEFSKYTTFCLPTSSFFFDDDCDAKEVIISNEGLPLPVTTKLNTRKSFYKEFLSIPPISMFLLIISLIMAFNVSYKVYESYKASHVLDINPIAGIGINIEPMTNGNGLSNNAVNEIRALDKIYDAYLK